MKNSFIVTDDPFLEPTGFEYLKISIGQYFIYYNSPITFHKYKKQSLVVIGYCYDCRNPEKSLKDIVADMAKISKFEMLLEASKYLSGVYLVMSWDENQNIKIIPDACCLRELYYVKSHKFFYAASSPSLLSKFFSETYLQSDGGQPCGDETIYKGIYRLKANHLLEASADSLKVSRFYPSLNLPRLAVGEAALQASEVLVNLMKAVTQNHKRVMMGLTAGWDSRILLASSKNVSNKILYYLFNHETATVDRKVSVKLAEQLNLNHIIYRYSRNPSDTNWQHQQTKNSNFTLPRHCQLLAQDFPDNVSISGNCSEIVRNFYPSIKKLNSDFLVSAAGLTKTKYNLSYYDNWLEVNEKVFAVHDYRLLDMFYWEEVLAIKLGKLISGFNDLNTTIFPPFNCRVLIEILLSVSPAMRQSQYNLLYLEIIKNNWPEVLNYSINPSFRKTAIKYMQKFKVYDLYRTVLPGGLS